MNMEWIGQIAFAVVLATAPSISARLQAAITRAEACHKWNNPGCLMYAGQAGAARGPGGYAVFKTPSAGRKSLRWQIRRHRGMKVADFLRNYNPARTDYASRVLALTDLKPSDAID